MHKEYLSKTLKKNKITHGEFPLMILLYMEGNKTQKEIAELFCFTESNAAKTIRKLEDKKYIKREINENNRRKKNVSLTKKGKTICKETIKLENQWEEKITQKFTKKEITFLKEALHEIFLESMQIIE